MFVLTTVTCYRECVSAESEKREGGGALHVVGNVQKIVFRGYSITFQAPVLYLTLNCNKNNNKHNNSDCLFLLDPRNASQLQGFSQASYRCSGPLTGSTAGRIDYLWSEIGRTIGGAKPPRDHCVSKQYTVPNLRRGPVLFLLASQGADAKLRDNLVARNLTRKVSSNFSLSTDRRSRCKNFSGG